MKQLTFDELKKHFVYDPDSGKFSRINRRGGNGSIDRYGYLILKINGIQYKAHRMAWLYVYGKLPKYNIDHINHNKLDNRINNLRDVLQAENIKNIPRLPNKETGVVGIYIDKCTKGLKSKFTFRREGKTYRFKTLKGALAIKNS